MSDVRPFRAFRPRPELAREVTSPPYDVMSAEEAREMALGSDKCFLHVIRAEIDLPEGADPHSSEVYQRGAANLKRLMDEGTLVRDGKPCFYLYQQRMGTHVQAGWVLAASVAEYQSNLIKKHEFTRPDKEEDRATHVQTLNANTGPVFLTFKADASLAEMAKQVQQGAPTYDFSAPDGIQHTAWVVDDAGLVERVRGAFAALDALYIADGHHRSAAAVRVCEQRRAANQAHTGDESYNHFMAVAFPHDQLKIMDYNRVLKDLNGLSEEAFLEKVRASFEVTPSDVARPDQPKTYGLYLGGRWHRLRAKPGTWPAGDPVASLDVAVLQNNLLAPILGITDPRRDKRIDFVGGIRGTAELEKRCKQGWALALALHPTGIEELMQVADAGEVMPPKSTWFEPKLRSGLFVRPLD